LTVSWPLSAARVREAVLQSCRMEIEAYKPGNVSIHAPGHGMSAEDFLRSAEVSAGILSRPRARVGERILGAVQATRAAVGCNTNLGILLLCAPLARAAQLDTAGADLRQRLRRVLADLDVADGVAVFEAIRLARPAGLGRAREHDVAAPCTVSLLEAMRAAADRDRIARQYASDYADVFEVGVPALRSQLAHGGALAGLPWATVACYLALLSRFPDTHVVRKFGSGIAEKLRIEAGGVESAFKVCENPTDAARLLETFDNKLKREGVNPGTSADLTVAGLLVHCLR